MGRRGRVGGIRVRTTAAALAAVGVALVVAAVAMVVFLDRSLREQVRSGAVARAAAIARGTDDALVSGGDPEEEFVQVLDPDGGVGASSPNVDGRPALVAIGAGGTRTLDDVPFEDGPFLVVAVADGEGTVVVGRSLEDARDATRTLTGTLVVAIPLLLVIVGAVTWRVVGRALRPVEDIRAEVEAISSEALERRVPAPSGDDEIARLATTMNRMLDRLEEGQVRQRRFVSDASHELRSPVASIRQHAEVALRHPETTDPRAFAEIAHEEAVRLQRIVEDLLLLTRVDEGTVRLRREPVDLADLVLEEAARLRARTHLRVLAEPVEDERVRGDREQLERLVRNLTDNAARHARREVRISLVRRDGSAILAVEDDGPGIPQVHRDRVFDRFVRLDEARQRDAGGSGLGLSIVREIARLHGGDAVALDARLGGVRVEIRLPSSRA